ncbi:NUDIX hydrolase [Streptomyces mobaraensis NBRC 13819 = DSM 40847]|uniref:NUDIX hydrolase n=1 Tax=Streptomyces mobaraensis (strain ATCC 29032 / DSM 40847 / JCM 4168 / NBRC 13819 / NCIMB 11159 / IPCR 16-22) TaxID=1223523 RepID=M3BKS7_STRM1|nr:NUDIX hydrolase [Streptomyces mobaraensis]EMF00205.1 NUDIX hydrolase [Streptomyces mobaraensis NBRC 13819 = DSM 40847]
MKPVRPPAGAEDAVVRAAGCVLWRRTPGGGVELALVHRPKYLDWSFPKGKLKRREDARAGALREVREETGMDCVLGPPLPTSRYPVADGRLKEVRYWAAQPAGGAFAPNREVDRLAWLSPDEARNRLTHDRDRGLVDALLAALGAE